MKLFTDSVAYARQVFSAAKDWAPWTSDSFSSTSELGGLAEHLYAGISIYWTSDDSNKEWEYAFLNEHVPFSHYDLLLELNGKNVVLPDRIVLLAGSGTGFHGQKKRPWAAVAGNIHLVTYYRPECKIRNYHAVFPIFTAISVVETIDMTEGLSGQSSIKWVNDIVIGRAKVAGFITHVQTQDDVIKTAVVGIGINVGEKPAVKPDPFISEVTSLQAEAPDPKTCRQDLVLSHLLERLAVNYRKLLSGQSSQLIEAYRERCMVIGRRVRIVSDSLDKEQQEIASGRVKGIGDHLEIYLEGVDKPVDRGRLILVE